jgi:hypothetical protein
MSVRVKFDIDASAPSPSGSPIADGTGTEESARNSESNPAEPSLRQPGATASKTWVPVLLDVRLRCERIDRDGTSQCVWLLQDDETKAESRFEAFYFKGSKTDEKAPVVQQYAQHGNMWCLIQRNDCLAIGAKVKYS